MQLSAGFKFEAAKRHGDIIHYSWILDCCSQKKLIPLQPKYFLFLSEVTRKKLQEEIDEFSDSYYMYIDLGEFKQLLNTINRSEDISTIDHYSKKYCPKDEWSVFIGCSIYFHTAIPSVKGEWEVLLQLALRRFKVEVLMGGGRVTDKLTCATHLVVLSVPGYDAEFDELQRCFTSVDRRFLQSKRLHIIKSHWFEDCLDNNKRLPEESYSLRPSVIAESTSENGENDTLESHFGGDNVQDQNVPSEKENRQRSAKAAHEHSLATVSHENVGPRKRGRPAGRGVKNVKMAGNKAQRARPRTVRKRAKISEYESDKSDSHDNEPEEQENDTGEASFDIYNRHLEPQEVEQQANVQVAETEESSEPNRAVHDLRNSSESERMYVPEIKMADRTNDQNSELANEIENRADPMLFDKIPGLATAKKVEDTKHCDLKEERPAAAAESSSTNAAEPTITKKKKVSYKDVANDLLKDW